MLGACLREWLAQRPGKQQLSLSDECCLWRWQAPDAVCLSVSECVVWRAAGYEEHVPITAEEVEERKQKVEEERKARRKKGGKKKHRKGDEL